MLGKFLSIFKKNKKMTQMNKVEEGGFVIKGNINSKGAKIYHLPEGRFYEVIQKPVQVFNTEKEAEEAGYRRSRM